MSDSSSGPPTTTNGGKEPTMGTEPMVGSSETSWTNDDGLNVHSSSSIQPSFTGCDDIPTNSISTTVTGCNLLHSSEIAKSPTESTSQSSNIHSEMNHPLDSKLNALSLPTDNIEHVSTDRSELSSLQDHSCISESVCTISLTEKELNMCAPQIEEGSHAGFLSGEIDIRTQVSPHILGNVSVVQPASEMLATNISNIDESNSISEVTPNESISAAPPEESSIQMQDLVQEQEFKSISSSVISHFHLGESQTSLIMPDSSSTLMRSTISSDGLTGICFSPPRTSSYEIPKGVSLPPVSTIIRSSALAAAKGRFDNPYPNLELTSSLSKTNSFPSLSSLDVQQTIINPHSSETMVTLANSVLSGMKDSSSLDTKIICISYSQTPDSHIPSRVCDSSSIMVTSAATSCLGPETNIPHTLLDDQSNSSKGLGAVTVDHSSLHSTQVHIDSLHEVSRGKVDADTSAELSLSGAVATSDSTTTDETSDFECISTLPHKDSDAVDSNLSHHMEQICQVESTTVIHSVPNQEITSEESASNITRSHSSHITQLPELIRVVSSSGNVQHMSVQTGNQTLPSQVSTSIPPIRTLLASQQIKPSSSPFSTSPNSGSLTENSNVQTQETEKIISESTMASLGITMEQDNPPQSENISAFQLAMETAVSTVSTSNTSSGTSVIQQFLATDSTQGRLSSVVHHPPGGVIASVMTNKIRSPATTIRTDNRHVHHSQSVITASTVMDTNKAPNSTITEYPLTSSMIDSGDSTVVTCTEPSVTTVSSPVSNTTDAAVTSPLSSIASVALPSTLTNLSPSALAFLQANFTALQSIPHTIPTTLTTEGAVQTSLNSSAVPNISPLLLPSIPSIVSSAISTSGPPIKQEPEDDISVTSTKTVAATPTNNSMYAALASLPSLLKNDGTVTGPLPPFTVVSGLSPIVKRELGTSLANTFLATQGTLSSGVMTIKQEKQESDIATLTSSESSATLPSLVRLPSIASVGISKITTTGAVTPLSTLTNPVPSQTSTVTFPSVAVTTATSTSSCTVATPTVLVGISAAAITSVASKDTIDDDDDKKMCCVMCKNGSPCGLHPTQTQGTSAQGPLLSTDPAKPFRCQLCGKHLASKNVYQLHMRSHSGEKPFTCNLCGHHFSQKTSLTRHMRSHTGERPFPCEVCGKRFADKERIKIHMRTHTGEKPFACEVCGKRFSQKSTVKRHMSVHTGEKPFKCEVCGKGFANRGNLNAHSKTHANT